MSSKPNRLKLCVTILLILGILTGILLICVTAHYHRILAVYFVKTARQYLVAQLTSIYLLGFEFVVCYLFGLILWRFIWKCEAILEYSKLLAALNGFWILVFLCGSITVWFQYCSIQYLKTAAESSLFQGIDLYFSEPEWKLQWDEIQYYNGCCGVNGYEDWKDAVWMPENGCQTINDSHILLMIPYACCKRSVTSCFQNYAPHVDETAIPYINSTDINTTGCIAKFSDDTYRLFYYLAVMILTVLLLQIFLFILGLTIISKAKRQFFGLRDDSNDNEELPLKYPRNVRCVTLPDEENFDGVDEEEDEERGRLLKCRTSARNCIRQEIISSCEPRQNIFLH